MHEDEFENAGEDDERPSKSQLKRDSHALQELGVRLVELPESQLATVPMDDPLRGAVDLARRIPQRGGRKRQVKYIGKLLRGMDVTPILEAMQALDASAAEAAARHHLVEHWRDRLIAEGDAAVGEFLDAHPQTDRQRLRQLVRSAQRERDKGAPPRHARELFRLIRETLS